MSKSLRIVVVGLGVGLSVLAAFAGEGRTPLWQVNTVISNPGKYTVTRNINAAGSGAPAIAVIVPGVDIDLNGFTVANDNANPVIVVTGVGNFTLRNGTLSGGTRSVDVEGPARGVLLEAVNALMPSQEGFYLFAVTDFAVVRCSILSAGEEAIYVEGLEIVAQGRIEGNRIEQCGGGIWVLYGSSVGIINNRLENLSLVASPVPPAQGAIVYLGSSAALIAQNTIPYVFGTITPTDGNGIYLYGSGGSKVCNNVIFYASYDGIDLAGTSD